MHITKIVPFNSNNLNILHINSRSLPKNIDNIIAFLNSLTTPSDFLVVTETWLNDTEKHLYQLSGHDSYHLVRNTSAQGKVSFNITHSIKCQELQELGMLKDSIIINTIKVIVNTSI